MRENRGRRRLQFGLLSFLLLVPAVALPMAWYGSLRRTRDARVAVINYFHPTVHFGAGPRKPLTFSQRLVGDMEDFPAMTVRVISPEDERRFVELQRLFPNTTIKREVLP